MEVKEYLKEIFALSKNYPIVAAAGVIGAMLLAFHYNGAERDPNNITLYSGLAFIIVSAPMQFFSLYRQSYKKDTLQCLNHDVALGPAEHVLRKYITKELFQLLSVRSEDSVMDVFAASASDGSTFTKRHEVFSLMKNTANGCTAALLPVLYPQHSAGSANVLRLVYDIHPGGAFFFGDCNVPDRNLFVFGYTNRQNNVNNCSDSMGKIIDDLRKAFGDHPPITRINDSE